jgi:hypothetical protein
MRPLPGIGMSTYTGRSDRVTADDLVQALQILASFQSFQ